MTHCFSVRDRASLMTGLRLIVGFYAALLFCLSVSGCSKGHGTGHESQTDRVDSQPSKTTEAEIRTFCGSCHVVPLPEMFPKSRWYAEVRRGYEFYFQSDRHDLKLPIQEDVVEYFRQRAPVKLAFTETEATSSTVRFRVQPCKLNSANSKPAISFIEAAAMKGEPVHLRFSDMRSGEIGDFAPLTNRYQPLKNTSANPAVTRVCDVDGNGKPDLIIADLGSFLPEDHHEGKVIWIRDYLLGEGKATTILDNVGRVADVYPADFNADGNLDFVVAEFGWHRTGGIHILWNEGIDENGGDYRFRDERIDLRPGAIHVPTVDLNGDGRTDFVALLSQEFEVVVAFLNLPDGFQKQTIFAAPDPSYGSTGIELIDFDRDGDIDVLYSNGDTFDSNLLKPCHGIRWFENEGTFPFKVHHIAAMPGVNRARAADLDGDGDFDIAASALAPQLVFETSGKTLETVVWFEQTISGTFERHVLKLDAPGHAALEVKDLDDDGDVDIAVGCFYEDAINESSTLIVFWNEGRNPP